ncbi:MAG: alpha/beta hydrolase [Actinomycetota bacterium]|nr:alpha/beta hydrolase [Actinomycetota bacterium]
MASPEAQLTRTKLRFTSGETECAAVLVQPESSGPVPCVVLGHGFGALKEGGPIRSAERFAAAGFAGLAFDYRYFGESGGEPRQLLDIKKQLSDWRAAIAYARTLDGVDPERIALWGSSFSGGHVIVLAAEARRVRAVIAQAPHIDGIKTLAQLGPANAARLTLAGVRDGVGALLGREPHRIPLVGPPGTTAAMTTPDAEPGYRSIYDEGFEWRQDFVPRVALAMPLYRPGRRAADVECPLLVQVASNDSITPPGPAIEAAGKAPRGELVTYAGLGHFDIYRGEHFERAVADQTDFLTRHLEG